MNPEPRTLTTFILLLLVAISGCAGYQIGNQSLYPVQVQTVHVPMFDSASLRPDLGERLTEAVVKEIQKRTPYTVVAAGNADTVLTGRLITDNKHLLFQTMTGDPRELELNMQVQVNWTDRTGRLLRQGSVHVPPDCVAITGTSEVVPEVGQSIATQQQDAINRLARQIVSLMEAPW